MCRPISAWYFERWLNQILGYLVSSFRFWCCVFIAAMYVTGLCLSTIESDSQSDPHVLVCYLSMCRRGLSHVHLHVGVCSWWWIWLAVGWTLERRGSELALYNCRHVSSDKWVIDMATFAGRHVRSLSDWQYSETWWSLVDSLGKTYDNNW